jgi:hypothetical protein
LFLRSWFQSGWSLARGTAPDPDIPKDVRWWRNGTNAQVFGGIQLEKIILDDVGKPAAMDVSLGRLPLISNIFSFIVT